MNDGKQLTWLAVSTEVFGLRSCWPFCGLLLLSEIGQNLSRGTAAGGGLLLRRLETLRQRLPGG